MDREAGMRRHRWWGLTDISALGMTTETPLLTRNVTWDVQNWVYVVLPSQCTEGDRQRWRTENLAE